jgi:hypothetical protein
MTRLLAAVQAISAPLDALQRRWALVGALAVSARAEPRFTRDVDLAVAVTDDKDAETLVRALRGRNFEILALLEQEVSGRLATGRLLPPGETPGGVVVDLLFASSGIEPELVAEAERLELADGLVVPVARAGHLLALKLLARDDEHRPQDQIDVRALLGVIDAQELVRARQAIATIAARGFAWVCGSPSGASSSATGGVSRPADGSGPRSSLSPIFEPEKQPSLNRAIRARSRVVSVN